METSDIINIVIAIITLFGIIVTMILTLRQISLSNKHQLFDRRLEKYSVIRSVIISYRVASGLCKTKDDLDGQIRIRSIMRQLLENAYMKDAANAVNNPQDENEYEAVNIKGHWLEYVSEEISVIFIGEEAVLVSKFIYFISFLLFELNCLNYWLCDDEEKEKQNLFKDDVYNNFRSIDKIYKKIEETDAVNKLLKQIKIL